MLRLPQVQGIIQSLVGDDPLYDHDFVHFLPPRGGFTQPLHMDAIVDSDDRSFDIQLFYYPHAVAADEGGTRFIPGSHLRRVRAEGICRYHHLLGEQFHEGPAGTLLVCHHGLWHAGQLNPGEQERWMYKIRLNPRVRQQSLWNTDDLASVHNNLDDHIFARVGGDTVATELRKMPAWVAGHEQRYELVQRVLLWRYLTGDDRYDVDYYLSRLETRAQNSGAPAR
jgi:ectoine hydroxylase-related dioxygenase (phytanoyl-CoA dioxygenase family)